jgi:hypothetical protein
MRCRIKTALLSQIDMTFGEQKWVAKKQKYSLKRIQDFASRSDFGKTKTRHFEKPWRHSFALTATSQIIFNSCALRYIRSHFCLLDLTL